MLEFLRTDVIPAIEDPHDKAEFEKELDYFGIIQQGIIVNN